MSESSVLLEKASVFIRVCRSAEALPVRVHELPLPGDLKDFRSPDDRSAFGQCVLLEPLLRGRRFEIVGLLSLACYRFASGVMSLLKRRGAALSIAVQE